MHYIPVAATRIAQRHLIANGYPLEAVDGDLDPNTEDALEHALADRADELKPEEANDIQNGSRNRKLTAYVQLLAHDAGIDAGPIDGLWGPQTDYGFDALQYHEEYGELPENWRQTPDIPNPHGWPMENEDALRDFYGEPGSNLTMIDLPYPHRLSWEKRTVLNELSCHERVAGSIIRVLQNVKEHYGMERIKELRLDLFGGCYNKRKKRGGSTWSTHAWGIALDYDPEHNKLPWGRTQAAFSRPEYAAWWSFWEEEGWINLGRTRNFDWMHVQAARPPSLS